MRALFCLVGLYCGLTFAATEEHLKVCRERGSDRPHGSIECLCPEGFKILTINDEYCPGVKRFSLTEILDKYYYGYEYRAPTLSLPAPSSYEEFKKIVLELNKTRPIEQLDDLLKLFSSDPRLRPFHLQHTRMHHSLSTQKGKRLLSRGGNLFLGIPLEESTRKERVEIFEVLPDARSDEFLKVHVLDFGSGAPIFTDNPLDPRVRKENRTIPNCAACHGNPPSLRWATYSYRPGAWRGLESRGTEPARMRFFERIGSDEQGTGPFARDDRFGIHIASVMHGKMVKSITEHPRVYERYKYAILGTLMTCDELTEEAGGMAAFLPEADKEKIEEKLGMTLAELQKATRLNIENDYRRRHKEEAIIARAWQAKWRKANPGKEAPDYPYYTGPVDVEEAVRDAETLDLTDTNLRTVTWMRYLLEGNGVDMSRWSTASTPQQISYAFNGPGAFNLNFLLYPFLARVLQDGDEDLLQYSFHNDWIFSAYHEHICGVLREKSLKALAH